MIDELTTRIRSFFGEHPELGVAAAYLFGSHAEERAHRESDVDVALLLDRTRYPSQKDRFDARVGLTSELIHVLRCNAVDVVILNDAPPLFGRRIVWDGRCVFVGDPALQHAFVCDVQLRAADLAPFLRRMQRIKLEALAR